MCGCEDDHLLEELRKTEKFTLQISDAGAWRNVVKATKEQMQEIEHHAGMIVKVIGEKRIKMRIIHSALGHVIGYCQHPDFVWAPAKIEIKEL